MCFIEKMNCIRIRKREDHIPDPVRSLGLVKYGGVSSSHLVVLVQRFRRFYKIIFKIFCYMHCDRLKT